MRRRLDCRARQGGLVMTGGVTEAFTSFGGWYNLTGSKRTAAHDG
jgi:hypothetical protein